MGLPPINSVFTTFPAAESEACRHHFSQLQAAKNEPPRHRNEANVPTLENGINYMDSLFQQSATSFTNARKTI